MIPPDDWKPGIFVAAIKGPPIYDFMGDGKVIGTDMSYQVPAEVVAVQFPFVVLKGRYEGRATVNVTRWEFIKLREDFVKESRKEE